MSWNFKIITDWDQIWEENHQKQWLEHMDASSNAHVFFHPSLIKAWVETYLPLRAISPLFVWAENESHNVAFLPLVLWRKNWKEAYMRSIVPVGYSDYDYHTPLFSFMPSIAQVNEFWHTLYRHLAKACYFDEFSMDGIHENYAPSGLQTITREACPFINLSEYKNLSDYQASLSSKLRGDLRRTMKHLHERSNFEMITYSITTLKEALSTLTTLLDYHRKRWPNAYKAPHFHENVVKYGLAHGVLHFTRLSMDGIPMSWIIGFIYKGTYGFWMPTMNADFSKYSPGKINLQLCIKYALEKNLCKYDHLRGDELYKSKLTDKCDYVVSFSFYQHSIWGALKRWFLSIKGMVRK